MTAADAIAAAMTEDQLETELRRIITDLRKTGRTVLAFHPWRQHAKRAAIGYPDWTIAGAGGFMVRELKREGKNPTREQQQWLDFLAAAGVDAGVWRPADWVSGRIARELAVVAGLAVAR